MNKLAHLRKLLKKWEQKEATEEEIKALFEYIEDPVHKMDGISLLEEQMGKYSLTQEDIIYWKERLKCQPAGILAAKTVRPRISYLKWTKWIAAACILALLGTGLYVENKSPKEQPQVAVKHSPDILPGKDGAILTLADGSEIVLDSLGNGLVANQNGTRILLSEGNLKYDAEGARKIGYNTISTPRGRQFMVILPDGSKAWLNAASSLKYPTAFTEQERRVQVNGEVYFEIKSDKSHPFVVNINGQTNVEVLGTSFNINAYEGEGVKTTLLTGSIKISRENGDHLTKSAILSLSGQQAQILNNEDNIETVTTDIDKVMAWKRGFFNFDNIHLDAVMLQLARWYDLEVKYTGKVPDIVFGGELSRNVDFSGILKALEDSKVHFKAEGRKITVFP